MDWDEIKAVLTPVRRGYPVAAAEAVLADPALIDRMADEFGAMAERLDDLKTSMFPLHAMHLLAQLRDARAFRPLLKIAALPSADLEEVLGDHLTESFDRCVASTCDDESLIRAFVEQPHYDIWARSALIDALVKRVMEGDSSRPDLIAWLRQYGERAIAWLRAEGKQPGDDAALIMDALAGALAEVGDAAELEILRTWWNDGWLDPEMADLDWYAERLALAFEKRRQELVARRGYVRGAIGEMRKWYCFSDRYHDRELRAASPRDWPDPAEPFQRDSPKVGRNDPCPCGSGKKFKKCCGQAA